MRRTAKRLVAMIIGMGGLLVAASPVFSEAGALPDPVTFTNSMELGDVRQAEQWLDAGLPPDYLGNRIGSGLMIGAWEGKLELMRLFISRGADIDLLNANGESALALAAWRGQLAAVKWLLERGARINAPDRKWSALHYAVFSGHGAVADYLIEQQAVDPMPFIDVTPDPVAVHDLALVIDNTSTETNPIFFTSGTNTFNNAGTLNKNSAVAQTLNVNGNINNTGTMHVATGQLDLANNGTHTGTFDIDPGTALRLTGGTQNLNAGIALTDTGALHVAGATVNVNTA